MKTTRLIFVHVEVKLESFLGRGWDHLFKLRDVARPKNQKGRFLRESHVCLITYAYLLTYLLTHGRWSAGARSQQSATKRFQTADQHDLRIGDARIDFSATRSSGTNSDPYCARTTARTNARFVHDYR